MLLLLEIAPVTDQHCSAGFTGSRINMYIWLFPLYLFSVLTSVRTEKGLTWDLITWVGPAPLSATKLNFSCFFHPPHLKKWSSSFFFMSLQRWRWCWQVTNQSNSFLEHLSTSARMTPASSRPSSTPPTCSTTSPTMLSSSNRPPSSERSSRYDFITLTVLSPCSLHRWSVSDR